MDLTVPIVVLLLVAGIPLRNKIIKEYRNKKSPLSGDEKNHNFNKKGSR